VRGHGVKNQILGLKIRKVECPRYTDEGTCRAATELSPLVSLMIAYEGSCPLPSFPP
jgi:hypothetical protein